MNAKTKNDIEEIKEKVIPILKRHNAIRADIFGSIARGEARKDSDIDILIGFSKNKRIGYFDLAKIIRELKKELNKEVHLTKYPARINKPIKEEILKESISIL